MPVGIHKRFRVVIVQAHPLVATYLMHLLADESRVSTSCVQSAMPRLKEISEPTLFLLDNRGLEFTATEYLARMNAHVRDPSIPMKFIVLDHQLDFYCACQLLAQGAHGFMTYDQVSDGLSLAVHSVLSGSVWLDCRILHKYIGIHQRERESLRTRQTEVALTLREEEILHCARQRMSNKEIAATLKIEVSTVKFHLSNIFSKLQIANKTELQGLLRSVA
jgi:DNA-binding NarL/FixJ family response regulator